MHTHTQVLTYNILMLLQASQLRHMEITLLNTVPSIYTCLSMGIDYIEQIQLHKPQNIVQQTC